LKQLSPVKSLAGAAKDLAGNSIVEPEFLRDAIPKRLTVCAQGARRRLLCGWQWNDRRSSDFPGHSRIPYS